MRYPLEQAIRGNGWCRAVLASMGVALLGCMAALDAQEPVLLPAVIDQPQVESESNIQWELQRLQQQIDELRAGAVTPVVCSPDPIAKPKFPTVRVTGLIQTDALWFDQDEANRTTLGAGDPVRGDIQDGADFRRARLAATGQAWDNVSYMLEMDFGFPGRPSFMDVWLDIDDVVGSNNLRIGQFRQPFGMDGLTSVREMTFLERGLPFAFLPFRQIGATLYGCDSDEVMTWAVSGFRYPTDFNGGNIGDNGGYGMAARLTGLLMNNGPGRGLVHLGGGYSFVDPSNDSFQYRSQPEVGIFETGGGVPAAAPTFVPPFVDTGIFQANNSNLFNVEFATALGSFYSQSEFYFVVVDRPGQSTVGFTGAYSQVGYFLTGESRTYNSKGGVFGRVKPNHSVGRGGGLGAWEVAGRWSYLDLTDDDILGGTLNDLTAGLNWYINPFTKFQFNYIYAMLDNPIYGDSEAGIFAMRAQVDF
ncbi:OprO/OprP family phosphate-selective porin [Rosistilla oblonga]|uniref:OprO/OprP family phosphate-selective porin n=1 Tax=Rosistilla oblonga TaxID=2527990 RepID=UPI003A976591